MLFPEEDSAAMQIAKSNQASVVQIPISGLNETIKGYNLVEFYSPRAQGLTFPYQNDTGVKTTESPAKTDIRFPLTSILRLGCLL